MQNGNPHGLHAARRSSATSCSTENTKTGPQNYAVTGGHTIQVHGKSQRTSLINKKYLNKEREFVMKRTKKILVTLFCAVLLVTGTVAVTVAYLTSTTEEVTNTFTVGDVKIILNETDVDKDILEDDVDYFHGEEKRDTKNAYHIFPNGTYAKDPMVSVKADSEDCYIRMIVTVSNIQKLIDAMPDYVAGDGTFLLEKLVDWNSTDWLFNNYDEVDGEGVYEFWYKGKYHVPDNATTIAVTGGKDGEEGEYVELAPLFEEIYLPADIDNKELAYLNNISIDVVAHAMQADGFESAEEAWEEWKPSK